MRRPISAGCDTLPMNDVLDVIHVFADNLPALLCGELAELNELVLCVLFVGADAGIDGDFHGFAFRGRPPFLPLRLAAAALALDLTEPPLLPMAVNQVRASFASLTRAILPKPLGFVKNHQRRDSADLRCGADRSNSFSSRHPNSRKWPISKWARRAIGYTRTTHSTTGSAAKRSRPTALTKVWKC